MDTNLHDLDPPPSPRGKAPKDKGLAREDACTPDGLRRPDSNKRLFSGLKKLGKKNRCSLHEDLQVGHMDNALMSAEDELPQTYEVLDDGKVKKQGKRGSALGIPKIFLKKRAAPSVPANDTYEDLGMVGSDLQRGAGPESKISTSKKSVRVAIRKAKSSVLTKVSLAPKIAKGKTKRGSPNSGRHNDIADLGAECKTCNKWQFFHGLWTCNSNHLLCTECFHCMFGEDNGQGEYICPEATCREILARHDSTTEYDDIHPISPTDEALYDEVKRDDRLRCDCCSAILMTDMVQCAEAHLFCYGCLEAYVDRIICGKSQHPLTCLVDDCSGVIPISQTERVLTKEKFEKFNAQIQREPNLMTGILSKVVYCPKCEFTIVPDDAAAVIECPRCRLMFSLVTAPAKKVEENREERELRV